MLGELLGHAAAGIGDRHREHGLIPRRVHRLVHLHGDAAALGRELHRIRQDVHENLRQAHLVASKPRVLDCARQLEADPAVGHGPALHLADIVDQRVHVERLARQINLAGLQLRHVQDVVHER